MELLAYDFLFKRPKSFSCSIAPKNRRAEELNPELSTLIRGQSGHLSMFCSTGNRTFIYLYHVTACNELYEYNGLSVFTPFQGVDCNGNDTGWIQTSRTAVVDLKYYIMGHLELCRQRLGLQ